MKTIGLWFGLALAMVGGAAWGHTCTPPVTPFPAFTGRMVYTVCTACNTMQESRALYLFDFHAVSTCTTPVLVPTAAWSLTGPVSPHFSPDGQAIIFSAVEPTGTEHDLYYWKIGDEWVTNLTPAAPGTLGLNRSEDPNFTPDGSSIVWKHTDNNSNTSLYLASLNFDGSGRPSVGAPTALATGMHGSPSEISGPVVTSDGAHVYVFTGSGDNRLVQGAPIGGGGVGLAYPQNLSESYAYYPVINRTSGVLTYVAGGTSDQIKYFPGGQANTFPQAGTATAWAGNDAGADNSDPTFIDGDYFIFSHDKNAGGNSDYDLYVGQLSTGQKWDLNVLGVNFPGAAMISADYTPTRPAVTPFSIGQPSYTPGQGCGQACRWP